MTDIGIGVKLKDLYNKKMDLCQNSKSVQFNLELNFKLFKNITDKYRERLLIS